MKRNNKGFTLVELLAVIVILAVIMIIATQQVNGLIKKSRMSSFNDSVGVAVKTAKIFIADENLTQERLRNGMDYSTNEYEIFLITPETGNYILVGAAKSEGKFGKVEASTEGFSPNNNFCYSNGNTEYSKIIAVELDRVTGKQSIGSLDGKTINIDEKEIKLSCYKASASGE